MPAQDPLTGHPRYSTVEELNAGAFGRVLLAHDNQKNVRVAVKLLERGRKVTENVVREIVNHRMLSHPHVIKFREAFLTESYLAIVLDYAERGDMYAYLSANGKLDEESARWIFQQVIVALDYLHKAGIACRDIKLENTLLCGGKPDRPLVKLCDFGYAKHVDLQSIPNSRVGTLVYMAPEVLMKPTYDGRVADLWSCGVMLYTMMVGQYPFHTRSGKSPAQEQQQTIERIIKGDYSIPPNVHMSDELQDLIKRLMTVDSEKRITLAELVEHPWFLVNLPPGALRMNDGVQTDITRQSLEEVMEIVEAAKTKAAG